MLSTATRFVCGIGDGTLDLERFRFWIRQDYLFLIEYSRLLALAAARAPDVNTMKRFANLVHETLHEEMDLHRSYSADLGIPAADLEREKTVRTTHDRFKIAAARETRGVGDGCAKGSIRRSAGVP